MLLKIKELCVLMIMVGTPVVLVSRNTTRLVPVLMSKAKELPATASTKNVVRNVPDITIPPAISRPDTSKPEAVRAVPVLNIRLNAILTAVIPELMLIVAPQAVAARVVKMTAELIIPNALARPCMNGARRRKNASAQRDINTLVPVPDIPEATATAVTTNIKNANALVDTHGMRRPELVSAAVPTNIPARAATSPAVTAIAVMENIRNANVKPDSRGVPLAECAFATAPTGARSTKTVRF